MFHKVEYSVYTSKLATIVSMLQSSIWVCFAVFFPIFNIPSFICLACGMGGAVVGGLFGGLGVLSLIVSILFCVFVDADKIEERRGKKNKKKPVPPAESYSQYPDFETMKRRSLVASQMAAEQKENENK